MTLYTADAIISIVCRGNMYLYCILNAKSPYVTVKVWGGTGGVVMQYINNSVQVSYPKKSKGGKENMKKILALVLALTMVLGTFTFVAAAPEDVVGEDCEDAVARLGALDVLAGYPDGTFRPDQPVTRAEFAKIIVSALGVGEAAQYAAGVTKFADVPADHWAAGYINVAVDLGIINGYPDGSFAPENPVTFAEAIKMIVAALGYTPKAEAMGGYPGGYLAVAAEEEITDGVNVVGTLAANRGAVAMMIDNSLEVYLMEQVSFGDRPTWEASDKKTLLNTKLRVEEVEGTVIDISRNPETKLANNKFVLEDDDGNEVTYEMVVDVNTESLFLKEVKLLHKDKKVVWANVETAASDIVFDTVIGFNGDDIKLKVADKTYKQVDNGTEFWVNYEELESEALPKIGDYGYFIFDGKEIKSACLFSFDPSEVAGEADKGFVTDVAKDEIEFVSLFDKSEQVLELDDYDKVYVYNKDFTAADLDDIDKDSVIFYWDNDDDEVSIMVMNVAVEGEVTRQRDDRVTVDGKNYVRSKIGGENYTVISLNAGKDFNIWDDNTIYDIMDEEVALYLDMNGNIAALVTSAKATSDKQYGIVTWYYEGRNPSIEVFTSEGKEVEYYFEERADAAEVDGYTYDGASFDIVAIEYELNSDGEIADNGITALTDKKNVSKDADKKFVSGGGKDYFITSSTVVMKALDDGELDPSIVGYDTLIGMEVDAAVGEAIIFGDDNKNAKLIVFTEDGFKGEKDDTYYGVVTDNPWKVGKNWFVDMDIFGEGKADYKVKESDNLKKKDLVAFRLDNNDRVALDGDIATVPGIVYERDGSYLKIKVGSEDPKLYRVASNAVLYKLDKDAKLDGTIRLSRINPDDGIEFLYDDEEKEIVAAIVDQY